jgi:hypothetical protein
MIPEAREVHLSRKDREVLEACCRSPVTLQRDLKRARIVLLAAAGRSTRSIAKEVGVQPRIGTLDALNCTTTGGWMPGGIKARMELVAETICAMARSRFDVGLEVDLLDRQTVQRLRFHVLDAVDA